MIKKTALLTALMALCVWLAAQGSFAYQNDYAPDVQFKGAPSPVDKETGSSVNQYGAGQTNSQIDNYVYQDEQINLDRLSGTVKVLRTNQKDQINKYVTAVVPLKHVNPRELRGLARTICRKEGGDADVLQDKVTKEKFLVIVCPDFQVPYVTKTLQALDHEWVQEVNDGSWYTYYKGKNRDVHAMMNIMKLYRSPDAVWDFDDANNAVLFYDQPNVEPLFAKGTSTVDIPPSQIMLDVAIYEVDTQNDLALGFDYESWKNGPGRDLFNLVSWNFNGRTPNALFPGHGAPIGADWGCFRSYNFLLTTAYIDFLQVKGKARLVTKSTLTAKSGSVGDLTAMDQVATFQSTPAAASTLSNVIPYKLSDVYDYFHDVGLPEAALSQGKLLDTPAANVIAVIQGVLKAGAKVDDAVIQGVTQELNGKVKNDRLTHDDLEGIFVPQPIVLAIFRDRTLRYLNSGEQVGVHFSVLPVVGLESADLTLSLDVSDLTGQTPAGLPIIERRSFSSDIEVKDGQPFVLSGIKRTSDVKSASGIPYLRDIPVLGYAFGHEVSSKQEKDMVVMITPRFKLCPLSDPTPPKEVQTAIKLIKENKEPAVPKTSFGFDQWLLDCEK